MHQALYRKWRPQVFDDVCGQEHITSILRYEVEHRAFSHAYLFCGSRGTGKTTCAKILAKAVNCEHPVNGNPCGTCASCQAIDSGAATDVLEMDAASNNGVDNIREIRDEVIYSPSSLRCRVYIIDEVHMLSTQAFNALLKTLEEPPEHVVFILATTELQKLPATIISRCQRFDFRRISTDVLIGRLTHIAKAEGIALEADAARLLARLAQGGMRDAISLLELCAGSRRSVTVETVEESVGLTGREAVMETVNAIVARDYDLLFSRIDEIVRSSKDIEVFWQDLLSLYRDILVVKTTERATAYLDLTDREAEALLSIASKLRKERVLYHCKLLEDALFAMQKANSVKRTVAEMTLVRMCDDTLDTSPEALLSRVAQLEDRVSMGAVAPVQTASAVREAPAAEREKAVPTREKPAEPPVKVKEAPSAPKAAPEKGRPESAEAPAKRVLRPLRTWMEVVERVGRGDPTRVGFLKAARAYTTEEGDVIVRVDNPFALTMLQQGDCPARIRAALSAVLQRQMDEQQLRLEVAGQATKASVIDEILEASEND
ncbi:MAG: DNA polymerase III subunit gamma/tau [Clostridia bacterium]|nr:DNA polymerase III subunit gamma/tau [Clostridia bacterium]